MRIFVTGATGFVGSAVIRELIGAGHRVTGLARSDEGARLLGTLGADVHRGDLDDRESLERGAAASDGIVHTAFNHDFSKFKENCEADRRVIDILGSALAGSARPLIVTSGIAILSRQDEPVTEDALPAAGALAPPRAASEEAAAVLAARGVNVSVVRLPPSVHGAGDHGFVPMLIGIAKEKGVSAYIGEGSNRWPSVHRHDAARLYRLVLENGTAGARYHAVADEGVAFREIAGVIGRRLGVPVVGKPSDEAAAHFGWFAHFAAMDIPASSGWTRETLQWHPTEQGLISDLNGPGYFQA